MKREELIKLVQEARKGSLNTNIITDNVYWTFDIDSESRIVDNFLATQPQESAKVTDKMIKTEMDNYFKKLQRNPLNDLERFRIEIAFEYAAKWAREQMKNR